MIIHLDTSALVAAFARDEQAQRSLTRAVDEGHRVTISTIVLYEWLRGPRTAAELELQETVLPRGAAVAFGSTEADMAARLYRQVTRARAREIDLAIAACALANGAVLWTLNSGDFKDIPGLRLW